MTCVRPLATVAALTFAVACAPAGDPNQLRVSGHVEATEVRLAPEMGGRVLTLDVKEGDRVEKGQLLMKLRLRISSCPRPISQAQRVTRRSSR